MRLSFDSSISYLALTLSALLYALHLYNTGPPDALNLEVPEDQFSAARAKEVLSDLLQEGKPHPIGSPENAFVKTRIENQLQKLGIQYEIQSEWACRYKSNHCGKVDNIVATIPGDKEEAILLMAHYDSVPPSMGAGDDGAGVAAILETARTLSLEQPLNRPVILLFTDGEEMGLLGAEAYFNQPRDNVAVVLNYEGSGTKGVSRVLRTSSENKQLINMFSLTAEPAVGNSISNEIFKVMPNDTDFSAVVRNNILGIDFAFADERSHYHTPNDNLENLDPRTLQHHGNNMLPLVRSLVTTPDLAASQAEVVYSDPYGLWVQWSLERQPIILGLSIALLFAATLSLRLGLRQLAIGIVAQAVIFSGGMLGGFVVFKLLNTVLGPFPGWPAELLGFRILVVSAPFCAALLILYFSRRFVTSSALMTGAYIWLAMLCCVAHWYAPNVANIFIVALGIGSLCLLLASRLIGIPSQMLQLATLVFAVPATLGLIHPIEASQGYGLVIGIYLGSCLFALHLVPFLVENAGKLTATSFVFVLTGLMLSGTSPLYSEYRPQQINMIYVEDLKNERASVAFRHSGELPNVLLEQHKVNKEPKPIAPFFQREYTPRLDVKPELGTGTQIEILEVAQGDHQRSIKFTLSSLRSVQSARLYFPKESGLLKYEIDGQTFSARKTNNAFDQIEFLGLYGRSLTAVVYFERAQPIEAYLASRFKHLPDGLMPLVKRRHPLGTPVHQGDLALSFAPLQL